MSIGIELPPSLTPPPGAGNFSGVIFRGRPPAKNDTKGVSPARWGRRVETVPSMCGYVGFPPATSVNVL